MFALFDVTTCVVALDSLPGQLYPTGSCFTINIDIEGTIFFSFFFFTEINLVVQDTDSQVDGDGASQHRQHSCVVRQKASVGANWRCDFIFSFTSLNHRVLRRTHADAEGPWPHRIYIVE